MLLKAHKHERKVIHTKTNILFRSVPVFGLWLILVSLSLVVLGDSDIAQLYPEDGWSWEVEEVGFRDQNSKDSEQLVPESPFGSPAVYDLLYRPQPPAPSYLVIPGDDGKDEWIEIEAEEPPPLLV